MKSVVAATLEVDLLVEGSHKLLNEFWRHQALAQTIDDQSLQRAPTDALTVRTVATAASSGTGEVIPPDRGVGAAALSAIYATAEQVAGTALFPKACGTRIGHPITLPDGSLPRLNRLPQGLLHDAERRYLLNEPCVPRIGAGSTTPACGVLQISESIPHEAPDIKLVVENACTARKVPTDCSVTPRSARRTSDRLLVQSACDRTRANSGRVVAEDRAYDFSFYFVDAASADLSGDKVVSIANASAG
jgi:hypothetical protein